MKRMFYPNALPSLGHTQLVEIRVEFNMLHEYSSICPVRHATAIKRIHLV
jgi:hypothetical protein